MLKQKCVCWTVPLSLLSEVGHLDEHSRSHGLRYVSESWLLCGMTSINLLRLWSTALVRKSNHAESASTVKWDSLERKGNMINITRMKISVNDISVNLLIINSIYNTRYKPCLCKKFFEILCYFGCLEEAKVHNDVRTFIFSHKTQLQSTCG